MIIDKNSVWQLKGAEEVEDGTYRVIEIFAHLDCVILFRLADKRHLTKPFGKLLSNFTSWAKLGTACISEFEVPHFLLVSEEEIDFKLKVKRDNNYSLIKELISDPEFLFDYSTSKRIPLLANYARRKGVDRKSISRLLNTYWRYGQTKNALIPAYANSGAAGKERGSKRSPLGAPRVSRTQGVERASKYILSRRDKEEIRKILIKYYLKSNKKYLTEVFQDYLREYHSKEIEIADACHRPPKIPSFRQFSYWKERLFTPATTIQKRSTDREYLLKKRSLLGSPLQDGLVPGSCFEIDATVADVHIVSSFGKQYALGRPTIYFIVDRATRMIVGFHVSLYHASWRAARQALVNCFLPKASYCAQYGIEIDESEWPCAHVPERLICDNGEMIGLQPQEKVVPFTELIFAPVYRPDYKSFVERKFKTINDKLLHQLKGSTRGGKVIRGDRNPQKDSIYTLYDVTTMLIDAALEHNRDMLKELALTSSLLLENDLAPTPINTWKIYISKHRHALSRPEPSEVISRLLPPEKVSMTRNGIQYKEMYYSCLQVEEQNLAATARVNGRWQLDARIDDNTVNYIYVRLGEKQGFTKCHLLPRNGILKDLPVIEVEFIQDWLDKYKEKAPITVESIGMKKRFKAIESRAKTRAKSNSLPYREKIKNIRASRREELKETTHTYSETNTESPNKSTLTKNVVVLLPKRNRKSGDS